MSASLYSATLPSFGASADKKRVKRTTFVLKGDGATIPSDQYVLDVLGGVVAQRTQDDTLVDVDWESYASMTWSGTIVDNGVTSTVTNEALTFSISDDEISSNIESEGTVTTRFVGNVFVDGGIDATWGTIADWDIFEDRLVKDTGADATSAGMSPVDFPFYAGATYAHRASAPFRVTPAGVLNATGAIISGSFSATGGTISGDLIVSGSLSNSATPARWVLSAAGLKTYNASAAQTSQILNDGSGWLGSSGVFSWTTAGVVSLNGSAVVDGSLNPSKTNFAIPLLSGLVLTDNSPSGGSLAWSSFSLTYLGTTHTVAGGNSANKYIYWQLSSPTVLQTSATAPAISDDTYLVALNLSGTGYATLFQNFIYAEHIRTTTLSAIAADLGSITAGTVTGATIRTASSGARVQMDTTGLFGYTASVGVFALPVTSLSWGGASESLSAGDIVVGDNSASKSNLAYIGGVLTLRTGTTNKVTVGTDGSLLVSMLGLMRVDVSIDSYGGAYPKTLDLDVSTDTFMRLTASGNFIISHIKKGKDGQVLILKNDSPVNMTLANNPASGAYGGISTYTGRAVKLKGYSVSWLVYDTANVRWTLMSTRAKASAKYELAVEGDDVPASVLIASTATRVAMGGTQVVAKSAASLDAEMAVPAAGTWTMEVSTPFDGSWVFANSDIVNVKGVNGEIWFTVAQDTLGADSQSYTCTYSSGTRSVSYYIGELALDYGASGQGHVILSSDMSGAPFVSIRTHAGSPWTTTTERARLGNLSGITDAVFGALSGYGLWTDNIYLTGAVNATSGAISGTLTVSGTLRSAASPNARYELTGTGLKTYDSGNVQRAQILNDGSGWLGSSSVFSWTAAGVVSLNGSAVVDNSLAANKTTFSAPTISGLTLTNNSPSAGYVAWSSFALTYQGVSYTVASGNSNAKYIYWKKATSTTVLQTSATVPANAADQFMVVLNLSGTAYQSNFAPYVYADYIAAGTITATQLSATAIDSMTITGATIRTASSGARVELNASNLFSLGFGGIGGYNGSTVMWYAKTSDGKIYAGGGNIFLDNNGVTFVQGTGLSNSLKWYNSSTLFYQVYGERNASNISYARHWLTPGTASDNTDFQILSDTNSATYVGQIHLEAACASTSAQIAMYGHPTGSTEIQMSPKVFIGYAGVSTTNPFMTHCGLSIYIDNAPQTNEIFSIGGNGIAHGFTTDTETDTALSVKVVSTTQGGALFTGLTSATIALRLRGWNVTDNTTRSTAATGCVIIDGAKKSGTSNGALGANGNILVVRDNTNARFLVDKEGDIHMDATSNINAWDSHDDIALLETYRVKTAGVNFARTFALDIERHAQVLSETGVLTFNADGHHFVSVKALFGLTIDAIRQTAHRVNELDERVARLENAIAI